MVGWGRILSWLGAAWLLLTELAEPDDLKRSKPWYNGTNTFALWPWLLKRQEFSGKITFRVWQARQLMRGRLAEAAESSWMCRAREVPAVLCSVRSAAVLCPLLVTANKKTQLFSKLIYKFMASKYKQCTLLKAAAFLWVCCRLTYYFYITFRSDDRTPFVQWY